MQIPDAAPGTTSGNHRVHFPGHLGTSPGMVTAARVHEPPLKAEHDSDLISPYKRGVTGSNPVAPTSKNVVAGGQETGLDHQI
jgi:hypothetical protein